MAKHEPVIAFRADPDGSRGRDVTFEALEQALKERRQRPRGAQHAPTKSQVTLRLDADMLARFRAIGPGWQTRINAALRAAEV